MDDEQFDRDTINENHIMNEFKFYVWSENVLVPWCGPNERNFIIGDVPDHV